MTLATMSIGFVAVCFALVWGARHVSEKIGALTGEMQSVRSTHEAYISSGRADWEARIVAVEDAVELLPRRWDHIRQEAERLDGRARSAVKRITKELEEHGLDDPIATGLARELHLVDGDGSGEPEVQPMPEGVASGEPEPSTARERILANFRR